MPHTPLLLLEAHGRHGLTTCNVPSPVMHSVEVLSLSPARGQSDDMLAVLMEDVLITNLLLPYCPVNLKIWGGITHISFPLFCTEGTDNQLPRSLRLVASTVFQGLKLIPLHLWHIPDTM